MASAALSSASFSKHFSFFSSLLFKVITLLNCSFLVYEAQNILAVFSFSKSVFLNVEISSKLVYKISNYFLKTCSLLFFKFKNAFIQSIFIHSIRLRSFLFERIYNFKLRNSILNFINQKYPFKKFTKHLKCLDTYPTHRLLSASIGSQINFFFKYRIIFSLIFPQIFIILKMNDSIKFGIRHFFYNGSIKPIGKYKIGKDLKAYRKTKNAISKWHNKAIYHSTQNLALKYHIKNTCFNEDTCRPYYGLGPKWSSCRGVDDVSPSGIAHSAHLLFIPNYFFSRKFFCLEMDRLIIYCMDSSQKCQKPSSWLINYQFHIHEFSKKNEASGQIFPFQLASSVELFSNLVFGTKRAYSRAPRVFFYPTFNLIKIPFITTPLTTLRMYRSNFKHCFFYYSIRLIAHRHLFYVALIHH